MTATEGRRLLECDWLTTHRSERLHHAQLTDEQEAEIAHASMLEEEHVTATCGRSLYWPSIPGVFSRMGMDRCHQCCDRLGYPRGVGSPTNDYACRPFVERRLA